MAFEFVKETGKPIDCVDIDPKLIEFGKKFAEKAGIDNVRFIMDSLSSLSRLPKNYYDQILLIDVLEHVNEDLESLLKINSFLIMDYILIISVQTPSYPKYFGYGFVKKDRSCKRRIHHRGLTRILNRSGFEIVEWSYHTNLLSPYFCQAGKGINSCGIVVKAKNVR